MLFSSNQFCIPIFLASTLIIFAMASDEHKERKLMGGWTEQDVNSDSIKEWANKAATQFNQQNNDANQHVVANIISAHSQVVAGAKYKLVVEFGRTNCKKGNVCGENEPVVSKHKYEVTIFSQPWTNTEQIDFKEI